MNMKLNETARQLIGSDPRHWSLSVETAAHKSAWLDGGGAQPTAMMSWSPPIGRSFRRSATSGVIPGWR